MLWIWANHGDCHYDGFFLHALVQIMVDTTDDEIQSFFLIASVMGLILPLAERFHIELLHENTLDDDSKRVITFFSAVSYHCSPVLHVEVKDFPQNFMQCIRIACQRQICLGMNDITTNDVLAVSLSVTMCVHLFIRLVYILMNDSRWV
jgi:hypothetical protein